MEEYRPLRTYHARIPCSVFEPLFSVFKPKDEEPYGRLNPKVGIQFAFLRFLIIMRRLLRQRNGSIVNLDG